MPNKTYNSVQLNIDFAAQVGDGTGRLSDAMLYSNISKNSSDKPSGASSFTNPNNLAVTLAKIYTWANDIFTFDPSGTTKIKIQDGKAKNTTYTFETGTTAGHFKVTSSDDPSNPDYIFPYKNIHADNVKIVKGSAADVIKLQWKNKDSNSWADLSTVTLGLLATSSDTGQVAGKIKTEFLPSYVDDIVEGYFYYTLLTSQPSSFDPTKYFKLVDGKYVPGSAGDAWAANTWYTPNFYQEAAHTTKITGESGKIYIDLSTNHSYRCVPGTPEVWFDISNPLDAAAIYELLGITDANGNVSTNSHGLVPTAPNDTTKFLRGDGTWATAMTSDEKVKNTYATNKSYYPAGMTQTSTTTGGQNADTAFKYIGESGTTSAVGKAQLQLGNSTASGTNGNKQGSLVLYGSTAYAHTIQGAPTAARTLTLPDKTGTIALTSDLPTVNNGKLTIKGGTTSVTEFTANQSGDSTLSIVAGDNVTITPDATNNKITIAATDTVYTHPTYTARTGKPTGNVTVDFSTVTSFTLSQVKSDGTGHVTEMNDRTVSFSLPSDIPRVPASGDRHNYYLRDDGTWHDPISEYTTLILNCTYDTTVT